MLPRWLPTGAVVVIASFESWTQKLLLQKWRSDYGKNNNECAGVIGAHGN